MLVHRPGGVLLLLELLKGEAQSWVALGLFSYIKACIQGSNNTCFVESKVATRIEIIFCCKELPSSSPKFYCYF